ncbi:hypothetical protein K435DRAFT_820090 [Dendrothele bispora CBS 962.96]|uniref:Auxin efflux carrier n=1 Tax=Dendrothele bispora (strain CBS 962.96) TaxID=1314807 RepID=A0A4S8LWD5_DENBC|nr:hypothetical protein K435DRAFT_820090 [Dendrothele bispora CBS 962.96]
MQISVSIVPLLLTVFSSIIQVLLISLAGFILAAKGVVDKKTQKQLNRLNVSLFTPALLFSKVAFFLSPEKLKQLWIIPVFFVIITIVSMLVAWFLGYIFRLKKTQRNFAMAASMFMNSNSLPIALMQSLVVTVNGLKMTTDDTSDSMLGRALTYLVLYSTLGMILRWSYGVKLLAQADDEQVSVSSVHNPYDDAGNVELQLPESDKEASQSSRLDIHNTSLNSTTQTDENSSNHIVDPQEHSTDENTSKTTKYRFLSFIHLSSRYVIRTWNGFNNFMTAPLWAALASIIVACITPLQHAIQVHLPPVTGAIASAGDCSIPITLVVLGAYFYPTRKNLQDTQSHENDQGHDGKEGKKGFDSFLLVARRVVRKTFEKKSHDPATRGETRTVIIAVISRMIVTPAILLPLIALSKHFDIHPLFRDPVFIVSNVLVIASAPALTLAQMTQAVSGDAFERLISRTFFWSYCIVTPPTTIVFVVIGLIISRL